jgi:N-methylhydantoinase A/oxoprolinase/acetone carboxylase beta subunit
MKRLWRRAFWRIFDRFLAGPIGDLENLQFRHPTNGDNGMIIGLDVGGTHTDVVLLGEEGLLREVKAPTRSSDLFGTVLDGIDRITDGFDPAQISRAVLSTTLTTNAIVQGQNPAVGMIVSAGPGIDPEAFRTNAHYYGVSGSIDHRGREVRPVDPDEIAEIAERFRSAGIRNIGIVSKFSTRNPSHERQIHDLLKDQFGKIFMGHQVSGSLNFPRRIATTYLNTTVRSVHKRFYEAVQNSLEQKGLTFPIYVLKADGGTMSFGASLDFPAQSILSGPAASVMGAIAFAPEQGECLVFDIGGTTTDIAILVDGAPLLDPLGITVGPHKTLIRSLETFSIGVGGDSAVTVAEGQLRVGPDRRGPAMAFGGSVPTPTDALFLLGRMTDGDRDRAAGGIAGIGSALGVSPEAAAGMILDGACRQILAAANGMVESVNSKPVYTIHELKEGLTVRPREILVLGGPAPYFAERLGAMSDFTVRVVPRWPVANAVGAGLARTTCEVTLFADTQQGLATAPEEGYKASVSKTYDRKAAVIQAEKLLREKALRMGAGDTDLETEVIEEMQFNMVKGFYTTGRNIRVRVQVKPGLIRGWEAVTRGLSGAPSS